MFHKPSRKETQMFHLIAGAGSIALGLAAAAVAKDSSVGWFVGSGMALIVGAIRDYPKES